MMMHHQTDSRVESYNYQFANASRLKLWPLNNVNCL